MKDTSWEAVESWYGPLVGKEGHYYHQNIIMPGVKRLLSLETVSAASLLDLACGTGILAHQIPQHIPYVGVDLSPSLIRRAQKEDKNSLHRYIVSDITKPLSIQEREFSHATLILAAQNVEHPEIVFQNAFEHLRPNGIFIIVINHPCFRIPRQSSWEIDPTKKLQYRRLDLYMSPLKIPIQTSPSRGTQSAVTWSFHYPLSTYCQWLYNNKFAIHLMEEWCSDKISHGKTAKMENRSRREFPLFLAILAKRN